MRYEPRPDETAYCRELERESGLDIELTTAHRRWMGKMRSLYSARVREEGYPEPTYEGIDSFGWIEALDQLAIDLKLRTADQIEARDNPSTPINQEVAA